MPLCPSTNRILDLFNRQLLTDRRKNVIVAEHLKQWQKLGGFPKGISTPSGRVRGLGRVRLSGVGGDNGS